MSDSEISASENTDVSVGDTATWENNSESNPRDSAVEPSAEQPQHGDAAAPAETTSEATEAGEVEQPAQAEAPENAESLPEVSAPEPSAEQNGPVVPGAQQTAAAPEEQEASAQVTTGTAEAQSPSAEAPQAQEAPVANEAVLEQETEQPQVEQTGETTDSPAVAAHEAAAPVESTPTPAAVPGQAAPAPAAPSTPSASAQFGRVDEDGTVYVRTPEGERAVGSYPGASAEDALAYFARKYDEIAAVADLLYQRVTQTDLSGKDASEGLAHLRAAAKDLNAVGDLVALDNKIETIATAVEARKAVENEQRTAARAEAIARREQIVAEAEKIAAQPENKIQWKQSSARMRELLDEWKAAQKNGPKIDRETEQGLWGRLSSSRNSFDKMRRVHFAQLGQQQSEAKAAKEELVAEAEKLQGSTDWGATAGAYKRLMDRWRQAGRASRSDDDALWKRFKAAQDTFFNRKDEVAAAEDEEFTANLAVKEQILAEANKLLPVKDLDKAKAQLRTLQDKWDAAGKVPRRDIDRMEKGMRRVEQAIREAGDRKWSSTNPEVAARAASLAEQAEQQLEKYRKALAKAEASGDQAKITKAKDALEAREQWLRQAQAGLAEFGR